MFSSLDRNGDGTISTDDLLSVLRQSGILADDPRLRPALTAIDQLEPNERAKLSFDHFKEITKGSSTVLLNAIKGNLVLPDFQAFSSELVDIFASIQAIDRGAVASYIPQLARVNPDQFGISVCTVDGQRLSLGNHRTPFCIQSVTKPINYCLALEEHGEAYVHRHIGREPSGRGFNELTLNNDGLPHNPMINSGAIMCCSMIQASLAPADRFDYVLSTWRRLAGGAAIGFNNPVYLSERQTADRNFALGYFMREKRAFPANTNLTETLEFYFQCCSIELDTDGLAVVAASLASGGLCPLTGERVVAPKTVQNCLSLMLSCGMYDFSGEFAFMIGLPAKSGVSGALLVVIPGVMGIAIWSPRLDQLGNSVRGVEACKRLVELYNFHNYDGLVSEIAQKRDPRLKRHQSKVEHGVSLCWAASEGNLCEVQRLAACGVALTGADYDGRTALHLAASEGHLNVVQYLVSQGVAIDVKDRWGGTPHMDATRAGHLDVKKVLENACAAVC